MEKYVWQVLQKNLFCPLRLPRFIVSRLWHFGQLALRFFYHEKSTL